MIMKMPSSILHLIPQNHFGRIIRSAGMSTLTGNSGVSSAPWLMLPPSSVEGEGGSGSMYSPSQGKVVRFESAGFKDKVLGSSHGCLALCNNYNLFLWNPITHQHIKLPPPPNIWSYFPTKERENWRGCVSEVMISCPLDQESTECVAMMTYDSGDGKKQLAFCFPGRSTVWTYLGGCSCDINVVYLSRSRRFLSLNENSERFSMKWLNLDHAYTCQPILEGRELYQIPRDRLQRRYVVCGHSDQLFLVTRLLGDSYGTVDFVVHRMSFDDEYEGRLRMECCMKESLDGLVLFVGPNHSSSAVAAADFPELKPNSIYFTGDDTGVYDYGNKTISPIYYPKGDHVQPPPFWFTPTPTPTYLSSISITD